MPAILPRFIQEQMIKFEHYCRELFQCSCGFRCRGKVEIVFDFELCAVLQCRPVFLPQGAAVNSKGGRTKRKYI